jgi:aerobic-type carbon monoxide dehydrogenase small subunit (CoxS/CutS family)
MEAPMPEQTVVVNGSAEPMTVAPLETLLDWLRDRLYLRGAKDGCREGECGACTVLVDGKPVVSCLYPAQAVVGRKVETIEGLRDEPAERLKQALVNFGAIQCGFCIPGVVVTLVALLRECPSPSEAQIRIALSGHLCRCTGYVHMIDATLSVAAPSEGAAA